MEPTVKSFPKVFLSEKGDKYVPNIIDCSRAVTGDHNLGFMGSIPDSVLSKFPDAALAITPEGVQLSRRVVFVDDEHGDILDRQYDGLYNFKFSRKEEITFRSWHMPWLVGGKPVVAQAFGDLASAEHDKAWINALSVSARFFGGARPEQYNATDARSVATLSDLSISPFRFLVRLANVYLSSYLSELGITGRKGNWCSGVDIRNVNNPSAHGSLLEAACVGNRDVLWIPNDITDLRRMSAIYAAVASDSYPFGSDMVLAQMWPALNNPIVAYCGRMDAHNHIEDYKFNSAEVMMVANLVTSHFGWQDMWEEALQFVATYATQHKKYTLCMGKNKMTQALPHSDMRPLGLGPLIGAKGGIFYEAPAWLRPERLLLVGTLRKLVLSTCEAAAVEDMGFFYDKLGLTKSLMRSLSLRSRIYDKATVAGQIACKYAESAGWSRLNSGLLMYRSIDTASSEMADCTLWDRYPGWHFVSSLGLSYPEGSDADCLHSLAQVTDMTLVSNEWHEVNVQNTTPLKAIMALQMMGGNFQYEIRGVGRSLEHKVVRLNPSLTGSYTPTLPLKVRRDTTAASLLFKPNDAVDVLRWNVRSRQLNRAGKFVIPDVPEINVLDDWYSTFNAPANIEAAIKEGRAELVALPSQARMQVLADRIRESFPDYADNVAQMAEARGRNGAEDEVRGMAKAMVNIGFMQTDWLSAIKDVPLAKRVRYAEDAQRVSSMLKEVLENMQERILAIQSEEQASHLLAAMRRNPALTIGEFREWNAQTNPNSVLAKAAWGHVPSQDQMVEAIKNGESIQDWLLRNNQGFNLAKAPHSTKAAKQKQQALDAEQNAKRVEASSRLQARMQASRQLLPTGEETSQRHSSSEGSTESEGSGNEEESDGDSQVDPEKSPDAQDFPSATSSGGHASQTTGSAVKDTSATRTPQITLGELTEEKSG
uniref:Coat protein n=1 Tax=Erysiphales associated totivirus 24 TaxID=2719854 RepID=A0A6G9EMZ2_9VIRU|nr:coat protein [Erysiphales associated totivirus 24]UTQ50925.1 MAG: coat protein [Erysiphales associated totivirus 24]